MRLYNNDLHNVYLDVTRHWSPLSEKYAGGDALLTLLDKGWVMGNTVFAEHFWHSGMRLVTVYHFELTRGEDVMAMPVIGNPFVRRVVMMMNLEVLPIEEREALRRRERGSGARS